MVKFFNLCIVKPESLISHLVLQVYLLQIPDEVIDSLVKITLSKGQLLISYAGVINCIEFD